MNLLGFTKVFLRCFGNMFLRSRNFVGTFVEICLAFFKHDGRISSQHRVFTISSKEAGCTIWENRYQKLAAVLVSGKEI